MRQLDLLAPLALGAMLTACVTVPETGDDDDYDETVYVDEEEAFDEGKADGLARTLPCEAGGALSINACAFLGTIAFAEGTHSHYDYTFAYRKFHSFADHPRIRVCAGSYCSTAAGRWRSTSGR